MFESTLEAQQLSAGERRFGTLSAAALAHLGFGLAIVVATTLVVRPPVTPKPPLDPFSIVAVIPMAEPTPRHDPAPPRPRRGTDNPGPARARTPPPEVRETPPVTTPETPLDSPTDTPPVGTDGSGEGPSGDSNGSSRGVDGGTGVDDGGSGGSGEGDEPIPLTVDMVRPMLVQKVAPNYPVAARLARLGGRVVVRAVIAPDGSVESAEVFSSTNRLFDEAALEAVRQWRYRPALMNGKPVRVYFSVVVDFKVH